MCALVSPLRSGVTGVQEPSRSEMESAVKLRIAPAFLTFRRTRLRVSVSALY